MRGGESGNVRPNSGTRASADQTWAPGRRGRQRHRPRFQNPKPSGAYCFLTREGWRSLVQISYLGWEVGSQGMSPKLCSRNTCGLDSTLDACPADSPFCPRYLPRRSVVLLKKEGEKGKLSPANAMQESGRTHRGAARQARLAGGGPDTPTPSPTPRLCRWPRTRACRPRLQTRKYWEKNRSRPVSDKSHQTTVLAHTSDDKKET